MTHTLQRSTTLQLPLARVFAFFEDPKNLAKITPPWLNFRIVDPERITMRKGAEIDYLIRWMGLRMKWKTLITEYDPPHRFVDEQTKGPYSYWHHEHTFEDTAGGVLIRDRVDYRLPFWVLGDIAHALVVRRQLEQIFDYREEVIRRTSL